MRRSTDGCSTDDHRDIHRVGLQPGLELGAGASDAVGLPVVDLTVKGSVSNGRWYERLLGRIDYEKVAEPGW